MAGGESTHLSNAYISNKMQFYRHISLYELKFVEHNFEQTVLPSYISFNKTLLDLLNSHGAKQCFKGDCINNEDDVNCFCPVETEERQLLKLLLSLFLSLSYAW